MKTRSKQSAAAKTRADKISATATTTTTSNLPTLLPRLSTPPKVVVLPQDISLDARIVSLQVFAATGPERRRFLVCPQRGFYEFTRISAPARSQRSWLLAPERKPIVKTAIYDGVPGAGDVGDSEDDGYVLQSPDLLAATPLDALFVLLAVKGVLWPNSTMDLPEYLSVDDRLYALKNASEALDQILHDTPNCELERALGSRIETVCDRENIPGDDTEPTYCLSVDKLFAELMEISGRVAAQGLPASMEEQFVTQPLRAPMRVVEREESSVSAATNTAIDIDSGISSTSTLQNSATSTETHESECTAATSISAASLGPSEHIGPTEEVKHLLRIRTVLDYLVTSYLPSDLRVALQERLARSQHRDNQSVNFKPLDDWLSRIADLKKEVQALRSLSDNISRKRPAMDDEEAMEKSEAKRRKKEEDEMKKKNMSRGVQQLKKADTSGMKKLSAFFTKAPAKKA